MNYSSYQLQYLGETYEETFDKISKFLPTGYSYTISDSSRFPCKPNNRGWVWWVNDDTDDTTDYYHTPSKPFRTHLDALKDLSEYLHKTYGAKQ